MKISRNWSDWEVVASEVAERHGIDNTPGRSAWIRATALICNVLQPLRDEAGRLDPTSFYRSPELNNHPEVNGWPNSQHLRGEAADITSPRYEPAGLALLAHSLDLPVDQCIVYPDRGFVHFSHTATQDNRGEYLIERGGNLMPWNPAQ